MKYKKQSANYPYKQDRKVPPYFPIRNTQKSTLINLLT